MAGKRPSGLGRGFYDIFEDNTPEGGGKLQTLRLSDVEPRSSQPRKTFDMEALEALADSVREYGVLQPILVQPAAHLEGSYEIIAGERRWRAARMAGLSEIPAIILEGDELRAAKVALIENVQREDLNPVEEALAYQALIERFGLTQDEVAKEVGKSRPAIANMLRLIDLPDGVLELLRAGSISAGHARAILGLDDPDEMAPLANRVVDRGLSVRDTERAVRLINLSKTAEPEPAELVSGSRQRRAYFHEVERRAMSTLGRRVRVVNTTKKKMLELSYVDDEDLEALLKTLCGEDFFGND